jgi:hypothetical protein
VIYDGALIILQGAAKHTTISSFVTSLGKNVRKYAEVGYQRLAVALPSKLSLEDLEEYTTLICKLCAKCQVILYHIGVDFCFVFNCSLICCRYWISGIHS